MPMPRSCPEQFAGWFAARGWHPRAHQLDLLDKVTTGLDTLLIAPTGGGKTLAGFLPSLIDLAAPAAQRNAESGVHTLYISPLKALAMDIARNLADARRRDGAARPARDPNRRYARNPAARASAFCRPIFC